MPIYEYLCQSCGDKFEKLVRRAEDSDAALEAGCPSCGQKRLQQEYSTFAAQTSSPAPQAAGGGCPSGMCQTPGLCGRN